MNSYWLAPSLQYLAVFNPINDLEPMNFAIDVDILSGQIDPLAETHIAHKDDWLSYILLAFRHCCPSGIQSIDDYLVSARYAFIVCLTSSELMCLHSLIAWSGTLVGFSFIY